MDDVEMADAASIHHIPPFEYPHQPSYFRQSYEAFARTQTPIVIDNGSTSLRWAFNTASNPAETLSVVSKFRERKSNRLLTLIGDGIDADSSARALARTPWEGDVLLNFDALENALDYAFIQLSINTPTVEHPILMSERLCSPLHSRGLTSELLFELYSVPSVAYCVDGIMSFYENNPTATADGLVVSFNTASTSVIPIVNGRGILSCAKRIPWGAQQSSDYLLKLIQLKYPTFPTRVTSLQSTWMLHNFCDYPIDYPGLLKSFCNPYNLRSSEVIVQFPFTLPVADEKSEEELARISEKKKEQGRKLQGMAATKRLEKIAQKEDDLRELIEFKGSKDTVSKREWINSLQAEGFDDENALDALIKKLDNDLKKAKKKAVAGDTDEPMEEPSYPLLDVPDADLDEEGLKEKKKQKLMRAGFEARIRARQEKAREREEKEYEERQEAEERESDLAGWSKKLKDEHDGLINRLKDRARRKAALTDRKSAVAQARMKNITSLATDERVSKKKRKGGGDDTFGEDDADWAIYRKINTNIESSDEEEDISRLQTIEEKLLIYDPTFTIRHTHASITSQKSALLNAFKPSYDPSDIEGSTRIHLNIERWRVCEALFSPAMAGVDAAGLGEVIQNVLTRFSEEKKGRMVKNVFLTGTSSKFAGLIPRLHAAMRPVLPPDMPIQIFRAENPSLNAWQGMARFSQTEEFLNISTTKAEYDEYGGERIKRWWGGNWNENISL